MMIFCTDYDVMFTILVFPIVIILLRLGELKDIQFLQMF